MRAAGFLGMGGGFRPDRSCCLKTVKKLTRLEVFVVADGHTGWSFDGFGGDEFCGIAFEFVDAVDKRVAVNCFGGVGEWSGGSPLLEDVIDMRAGDGAGLAGGRWVDGEGEHRFEGAKFDGTLDLGGHAVAAFRSLGNCFGDGFEDAAQRG